jgi:uncharacterized protein
MEYRRFGKTNENISVITLGGMRFKHGWNPPRSHLPAESVKNCIEIVQKAVDLGINHFETAYGYMKSEHLFGKVLEEIGVPRKNYKLMTKGAPMTGDETRKLVEEQLNALKLEKIDFYGWHGINNEERFRNATQKGGPIEELHKLKEEGIIGHIGFSTHGSLDLITKALETNLFSFVNLHFYYFFQRHLPAVELAAKKDVGVFIISPNEKGGMLWNPSKKVRELCDPLTPIQFNGRFCLSYPQITTLSMGIHEIDQFEQNLSILTGENYAKDDEYLNVKKSMDNPLEILSQRCTLCDQCLPCPENINIPEVLRFRNLLKSYDMSAYGEYRYNMLEEKDHWFPGAYASKCTECGDCLPRCPENLQIPTLLFETHNELFLKWDYIKKTIYEFFKTIIKTLIAKNKST